MTLREPQVSVHRKNATSSAHIYGKPPFRLRALHFERARLPKLRTATSSTWKS